MGDGGGTPIQDREEKRQKLAFHSDFIKAL